MAKFFYAPSHFGPSDPNLGTYLLGSECRNLRLPSTRLSILVRGRERNIKSWKSKHRQNYTETCPAGLSVFLFLTHLVAASAYRATDLPLDRTAHNAVLHSAWLCTYSLHSDLPKQRLEIMRNNLDYKVHIQRHVQLLFEANGRWHTRRSGTKPSDLFKYV